MRQAARARCTETEMQHGLLICHPAKWRYVLARSVCGISGYAIELNCPYFRSGLFSAKGTFLRQPRVERRESANVAEPWETRVERNRKPQRGGPNRQIYASLGPPLWGFGFGDPSRPGLRDVRFPHVPPPWAGLGSSLRDWNKNRHYETHPPIVVTTPFMISLLAAGYIQRSMFFITTLSKSRDFYYL